MKNTIFAGVTILALLALLELGIRGWTWASGSLPICADKSLEEEWEFARRYVGTGVFSHGPGTSTAWDPDLGWTLRPGFQGEGVTINSQGHRGPVEVPLERDPAKTRIVFVGDSYTHGFQSKDEETFQAVLREEFLPGIETVNLGVSGYGVDQAVLNYEKNGTRFSPDIVVLGIYSRDVSRNLLSFRGYAKPRFEVREGELVLATEKIPSPTELLSLYEKGERRIQSPPLILGEVLKATLRQVREMRVTESSPDWVLMAAILDRFTEKVAREGAKPFLLIIPHKNILDGDGRTSDLCELIQTYAETEGVAALNLAPVFQDRNGDGRGDIYDGHLTAYGNRVVAEELKKALVAQGLVASQ